MSCEETKGTVISAKTQWWLKINTKPVRMGAMDGATFPHIIKVQYTANGKPYTKRKWIAAGRPVPVPGSTVTVFYQEDHPKRASIV